MNSADEKGKTNDNELCRVLTFEVFQNAFPDSLRRPAKTRFPTGYSGIINRSATASDAVADLFCGRIYMRLLFGGVPDCYPDIILNRARSVQPEQLRSGIRSETCDDQTKNRSTAGLRAPCRLP